MKKYCSCGSSAFKCTSCEDVIVTIDDEGIQLVKESGKKNYINFVCKCKKAYATQDDLLEELPKICVKCNKSVSNVNDDGVCEICELLENRKDLANASPTDLLLKILELEKQLKATSKSNTKMLSKINPPSKEESEISTEEEKPVSKPKKKKTKKVEEPIEEPIEESDSMFDNLDDEQPPSFDADVEDMF